MEGKKSKATQKMKRRKKEKVEVVVGVKVYLEARSIQFRFDPRTQRRNLGQ